MMATTVARVSSGRLAIVGLIVSGSVESSSEDSLATLAAASSAAGGGGGGGGGATLAASAARSRFPQSKRCARLNSLRACPAREARPPGKKAVRGASDRPSRFGSEARNASL
mmetsp:Transcript_22380/g.62988  ORF Transcript_22380/g.62988 Transcript_22380/m.62988 type:complete len:112 (-) Transcript_22380:254-589(-)